ncbi:MAG TPA: phenylalanine--tRNA ligase subunit beta, partial [Anaerolineales bacterium]|nr:phenylalanine--tRNA ligase subunit beta [Anaerolineales bacterium]
GETIETLDGEERELEPFTVLICDSVGPHSLAGIMGGMETEVTEKTTNVLLEGANWNYINIRQSLGYLRMHSEASYRFSRGVHPEMAIRGVQRGIELMRQWSGGVVAKGLVDEYPLPANDPTVTVSPKDVQRWLGIDLTPAEIAEILSRLDFKCEVDGEQVQATTPDHRLDIESDLITGKADVMEEIARIYGYENIPATRMEDVLPVQRNTPELDFEEGVRDTLARLGLQEIISYRLTSSESEARRIPPGLEPDTMPYVEIINPIAAGRNVMRKSIMASVLETVELNAKTRQRITLFEIGPVFFSSEQGSLPDELTRLGIVMTGRRHPLHWQNAESQNLDFYDLKGVVESLLDAVHISGVSYEAHTYPLYHPGKCAAIMVDGKQLGVMGELHPMVKAQYNLLEYPVYGAFFYMDKLFEESPSRHQASAISPYPPVLEDIALIVDETIPAADVEFLIAQTGGKTVTDVRLFDVYRGEQLGEGKKSLAYSLTYQAPDRTLTDDEVAKVRKKIVKRLEREMNAQLRDRK